MSVCQFIEIGRARQELTNGKRCAGYFRFNSLEVVQIPSFADYLKSVIQINLITVFDFTWSKGDPKFKSLLHHISKDDDLINQCQQCLYSFLSVVINIDSSQKKSFFLVSERKLTVV
ncbi:hypothetical protein M9Y10_007808 [Tritrichomonas musculus]|uniref:Uncharacterized protein n=1 Tax=Tritrichomonas musculus TaxID=1915356 RepID=A0ABR2J4A2_9EUKA